MVRFSWETSDGSSRFGVAEQAINAIYLLASQPDVLCGDIVKEKTRSVFQKESRTPSTSKSVDVEDPEPTSTSFRGLSSVRSLSQLLFIVGHAASKFELMGSS
jgi:condensin complex subunit 1